MRAALISRAVRKQIILNKFIFIFFPDPEESISGVKFQQPFAMASAYEKPKFTNYTVGFVDCLDYIFYEKNKLEIESVVPLPSEEDINKHIALPNAIAPSDHLALVCDFKWVED